MGPLCAPLPCLRTRADGREARTQAVARAADLNLVAKQVLNMDQTICAFAYDNSRARYSKWVGRTNPNSPQLPWPVSASFTLLARASSHARTRPACLRARPACLRVCILLEARRLQGTRKAAQLGSRRDARRVQDLTHRVAATGARPQQRRLGLAPPLLAHPPSGPTDLGHKLFALGHPL